MTSDQTTAQFQRTNTTLAAGAMLAIAAAGTAATRCFWCDGPEAIHRAAGCTAYHSNLTPRCQDSRVIGG